MSADQHTARHEAAHALAYVALGIEFRTVSAGEAFTAPVPGNVIKKWDAANLAMAGAVWEVFTYMDRSSAELDDALTHYLDLWLSFATGEDSEQDDIHGTHGFLMVSLAWAWAFMIENRALVEELGDSIIDAGEC